MKQPNATAHATRSLEAQCHWIGIRKHRENNRIEPKICERKDYRLTMYFSTPSTLYEWHRRMSNIQTFAAYSQQYSVRRTSDPFSRWAHLVTIFRHIFVIIRSGALNVGGSATLAKRFQTPNGGWFVEAFSVWRKLYGQAAGRLIRVSVSLFHSFIYLFSSQHRHSTIP